MQRIAAGIIWIALLPLPGQVMAKPDTVPVFDFAHSCREARGFAGENRNLAYQGCLKDENDARAELALKWTHFKTEDRRDCVAQGAAPMPSYVEILTCLEMSEQARALYNPDGSARDKPDRPGQGLSGPNMAAPPAASGVPVPSGYPPAPKPAE